MSVRQQIIEDQVDRVADQLGISTDDAFLRLSHALLVGRSVLDFDEDDIVDGGQDKQIDAITIEEDGSGADIWILQSKHSPGFSSNALIQMRNGLLWMFDKPKQEVSALKNQAFKDKIVEFRSVRTDRSPANLRLHVAYVSMGSTDEDIGEEFEQELRTIRDAYSGDLYGSFEVKPYGADELVSLLNTQERRSRSIDADLRMLYDVNTGSMISHNVQGLKGMVCTMPAQQIASLVNDDATGSVFDLNLRRFLGGHGAVNKDIMDTCSNPEVSHEFWFLNNGITIVCDHFDPLRDPDTPRVRLKNLQIVNGCQTATTLAVAQKEGTLAPDVRVMVRIYETPESDLVDKIVLTTNNQNRISNRDLRANDAVQIDMERGFEIYGFHYERKARQFASAEVEPSVVFSNEFVAQWYLAVVLRNPADARGRKYKVWGEHYDSIFSGKQRIEPYIAASLLGRRVAQWMNRSGLKSSPDDVNRMLAKRGAFHVGRMASFHWRGGDKWKEPKDRLAQQIDELRAEDEDIDSHIEWAFGVLERSIRKGDGFVEDIDRSLKSYVLNETLDKALYKSRNAMRR